MARILVIIGVLLLALGLTSGGLAVTQRPLEAAFGSELESSDTSSDSPPDVEPSPTAEGVEGEPTASAEEDLLTATAASGSSDSPTTTPAPTATSGSVIEATPLGGEPAATATLPEGVGGGGWVLPDLACVYDPNLNCHTQCSDPDFFNACDEAAALIEEQGASADYWFECMGSYNINDEDTANYCLDEAWEYRYHNPFEVVSNISYLSAEKVLTGVGSCDFAGIGGLVINQFGQHLTDHWVAVYPVGSGDIFYALSGDVPDLGQSGWVVQLDDQPLGGAYEVVLLSPDGRDELSQPVRVDMTPDCNRTLAVLVFEQRSEFYMTPTPYPTPTAAAGKRYERGQERPNRQGQEHVFVEAEYPERLAVTDSSFVRVSLVRTFDDSYEVTVEAPDTTSVVVEVEPPPGAEEGVELPDAFGTDYRALATAELIGPGFDITAVGGAQQSLEQDRIEWVWSIKPNSGSGTQTLIVTINGTWEPTDGTSETITRQLWRSTFSIRVRQALFETGTLNLTAILSSLIGSALSIPWMLEVFQKRRKKKEEAAQVAAAPPPAMAAPPPPAPAAPAAPPTPADPSAVTSVGSGPDAMTTRIPATGIEGPHLVGLHGQHEGLTLVIAEGTTSVGRSTESDMQLTERSVSRVHANLIRQGADVYLENLTGSGLTFVNHQVVEGRVKLKHGDDIQLGRFELFEFRQQG